MVNGGENEDIEESENYFDIDENPRRHKFDSLIFIERSWSEIRKQNVLSRKVFFPLKIRR